LTIVAFAGTAIGRTTCSEITMRRILSLLAVGLATAQTLTMLPGAALAAPLPPAALSAGAGAQMASPLALHKAKTSNLKVKIDPMNNVKRGQTAVPVHVTLPTSGYVCKLSIKYYGNDDEDSPDDVGADATGICQFTFDVPNKKDAIGDAKATVKIVDGKGKQQGEASVNFDVRN
jgi:hypothetical protein